MSSNRLKSFLSHRRTRSVLTQAAGWIFLVLGILGFALPLLQGILFTVIGISLLANHNPFFKRIRDRVYHRYPGLEKAVHREHARLRLFLSRRRRRRRRLARSDSTHD